jgi:hypothetical protein
MSLQSDVAQFMESLQPDEDKGYVPLDVVVISKQLGYASDKVSKALYNLGNRGKVEFVRGPNGRDIIGFRPIDLSDRRGKRAVAKVQHTKPTSRVYTPHLDEYATIKGKFNRFLAEMGPLVTATFEENKYAEEGLRLRERLGAVEPGYAELRAQLDEALADVRHLRGKLRQEMAAAVKENGAAVVHSETH